MNQPHEQFKALADPTRLRIAVLLTTGELCVCDILATLHLPQSTISRQLGIMKAAGLVTDRRNGRWVHYCLSDNVVERTLRPLLAEHLAAQPPYVDDLSTLKIYREKRACE